MSETLSIDDPEAISRAVEALEDGRLVVVPTDTVYAVVADAFSPQATRRLMRARGAGRNRPVPVFIGSSRQLSALATDVPETAARLSETHWPGPLTLVLQAVSGMTWDLGNTAGAVAVRMPDEPFLRELIGEVGPLAGTGASRRGREPSPTVDAARAHFGDAVALYLDGDRREGQPSTIVDASRGERLTVLREGAVPADEIVAAPDDDPPEGDALPEGDEVPEDDEVPEGEEDVTDAASERDPDETDDRSS